MTINEKIKKAMDIRNITYYELAKRLKVSPTTTKAWFQTVPTTPSYALVEATAKALDMKVEELVADNLEPDPQTKQMIDLWRSLGTTERSCVLTVMTTIIQHK